MKRYLLVRAHDRALVANPHAPAHTRRMLGKMPNGVYWDEGPIDEDTKLPKWPAAGPCDEVVEDEASIRKACQPQRKSLMLLAECVAKDITEAREKLKKAPAPARAEVK